MESGPRWFTIIPTINTLCPVECSILLNVWVHLPNYLGVSVFFFLFIMRNINLSYTNSEDHFLVSDMSMHFLSLSYFWNAKQRMIRKTLNFR